VLGLVFTDWNVSRSIDEGWNGRENEAREMVNQPSSDWETGDGHETNDQRDARRYTGASPRNPVEDAGDDRERPLASSSWLERSKCVFSCRSPIVVVGRCNDREACSLVDEDIGGLEDRVGKESELEVRLGNVIFGRGVLESGDLRLSNQRHDEFSDVPACAPTKAKREKTK
jgi:hypothetical protein